MPALFTLTNAGDSGTFHTAAAAVVTAAGTPAGGTLAFFASPDANPANFVPVQATRLDSGAAAATHVLAGGVGAGFTINTPGMAYVKVSTPTGFGTPCTVEGLTLSEPVGGGGGGAGGGAVTVTSGTVSLTGGVKTTFPALVDGSGNALTIQSAQGTAGSTGAGNVVAAGQVGKKIYVLGYTVQAATVAASVNFQDNAGTPLVLTPPWKLDPAGPVAGVSRQAPSTQYLWATGTGNDLRLNTTGTGVLYEVTYVVM